MARTLFISDLHLARERPDATEALHALTRDARGSTALYVLGDLFDAWLGDDQVREPFAASVARSLAALAADGTRVYLQRGNRDFLLGERFARASGATLLSDVEVHDVERRPTLVMHGDLLCTDDAKYQRWRHYAFSERGRARLLAYPYAVRRGIAVVLRAVSRRANATKPEAIMDVNDDAVAEALRTHGYPRLIHGHTHRPARHEHEVDGRACERWVLGDWFGEPGYLEVTPERVTPRRVR